MQNNTRNGNGSSNGDASPAPKKINLRRPDVMAAVQAQVLSHYRSELVERIRDKGHVLSADGLLTVKLAKKYGFCYGVERAIDLAYAARNVFPLPAAHLSAGRDHSQPGSQRPDSQHGHPDHFAQAHASRNWNASRPATWSSSRLLAPKWARATNWWPKAAGWWTPLAGT